MIALVRWSPCYQYFAEICFTAQTILGFNRIDWMKVLNQQDTFSVSQLNGRVDQPHFTHYATSSASRTKIHFCLCVEIQNAYPISLAYCESFKRIVAMLKVLNLLLSLQYGHNSFSFIYFSFISSSLCSIIIAFVTHLECNSILIYSIIEISLWLDRHLSHWQSHGDHDDFGSLSESLTFQLFMPFFSSVWWFAIQCSNKSWFLCFSFVLFYVCFI